MNLEEAEARYLEQLTKHEDSRFAMGEIALQVRAEFGRKGLQSISQTVHRKTSTLIAEAEIFEMKPLLDDRPTLTWTHLSVLRPLKDEEREGWADLASDSDWSPAELRRQIAASKGVKDDASTVIAKADSGAEKFKQTADEAEVLGVLSQVAEKAKSVVAYIDSKANNGRSDL